MAAPHLMTMTPSRQPGRLRLPGPLQALAATFGRWFRSGGEATTSEDRARARRFLWLCAAASKGGGWDEPAPWVKPSGFPVGEADLVGPEVEELIDAVLAERAGSGAGRAEFSASAGDVDMRGLAGRLLPAEEAGLEARRSARSSAAATFASATVEFCGPGAPCQPSGDVVRRKGVIWRAGAYPTQGFEMSPVELAQYARTFSPIPIRHAHSRAAGPLDGSLGTLESVELAPDGKTLLGVAAFPRWLEELLGAARRFVSATFDPATRRMRSLDLVLNPQIPDAELLAAFARSQPPDPRTPTVSEETPADRRARLDRHLSHTDIGRAALARRNAAASSPATFSASAPSAPPLSPVARRHLESTAWGRDALARRDNPPPAAGPSTTPSPPSGVQIVYQVAPAEPQPIQVPDEAEGEFLADLGRGRGEAALAALDREIAALTNQISYYADQYRANGRMGWSAEVRSHAADRARLQAMREAMARAQKGKAPAFRPPSPADIAAAQAEAVVRGALSAGAALRLGTPPARLPEVVARIEALRARLAGVPLPGGDTLAEVREQYHKDRLELAALEAERPALERAAGGMLEKALAGLVAPIVAEAGGPSSLARDLAEVRLSDPENKLVADPESAEKLAGLAAKLADLGASPTSPDGGRIVLALQARHATLVEAVEAERREHRGGIVAKAETVVAQLVGYRPDCCENML